MKFKGVAGEIDFTKGFAVNYGNAELFKIVGGKVVEVEGLLSSKFQQR